MRYEPKETTSLDAVEAVDGHRDAGPHTDVEGRLGVQDAVARPPDGRDREADRRDELADTGTVRPTVVTSSPMPVTARPMAATSSPTPVTAKPMNVKTGSKSGRGAGGGVFHPRGPGRGIAATKQADVAAFRGHAGAESHRPRRPAEPA